MLFLVSRQYDEDGMLESEIEFELGQFDTVDDLVSRLKKMNDAKSVMEVSENYTAALDHIRFWALECYAKITQRLKNESIDETHDARVRAAGGL